MALSAKQAKKLVDNWKQTRKAFDEVGGSSMSDEVVGFAQEGRAAQEATPAALE